MEIRQCLVVGTDPSCDFVVRGDRFVSPRHCMFSQLRGKSAIYVEDLGSTNGTYVVRGRDNFPIRTKMLVTPHMIVRVGRTILRVPDWLSQSASKSPHGPSADDRPQFTPEAFREAAEAAQAFLEQMRSHRWP